jgi:osmotically inducible protein OsmC
MADIERSAQAAWTGDLREGEGKFSSTSGVFNDVPYSFRTRFEQAPGTNPEELIAAAHAACYSMAFSATLGRKGFQPKRVETTATVHLTPQQPSGFKITKVRLVTRGEVDGIDDATFKEIAAEAEKGCPVSNALRAIDIELDAALMK